jgi:(hydroxyamino)benzene mutase
MEPSMASTLCFTGMLLFLLGLLNGLVIPKMRSPRLGLSGHLTGVQSGTFLIAAGLLWPKLVLARPWNAVVGHTMWISLFSIWLSLALAGAFGAGRGLPIAGQGMTTTAGRQTLVSVLLIGGSLALLAAVAALLILWRWAP